MFGNNIKVHFAGCEQVAFSECCLEAGAHYMLFTVFGFICKQFGISCFPCTGAKESPSRIRILKSQMRDYRHVIMDSGLFTLMFGAKAGKRDEKFICAWMEALCRFVHENDIRATCVEVDCQKILGVEEAWRMRERMRAMLPDRRMINVFHMEDGKKGLDRLIEYADYIAISVPELRRHYGFGVAHEKAVVRLAHYIKNSKPSIDIHLLGCTDKNLLRLCNFCTSADSTSWQEMNRYGSMMLLGKRRHVSNIIPKALSPIKERLRERFTQRGIRISKNEDYFARYVVCVQCCMLDYERAAGDQS